MLTRRTVCVGFAAAALVSIAQAQLQPLRIRVVRDRSGLPATLLLTSCIRGELYIANDFDGAVGEKLCETVELPYVMNVNVFSAIPTGRYTAFVRTDGPRGWRIEFNGTGKRHNIQIHTGNRPSDVEGCILVGQQDPANKCSIVGGTSKPAREALRAKYGNSNVRGIEVSIEEK